MSKDWDHPESSYCTYIRFSQSLFSGGVTGECSGQGLLKIKMSKGCK